MKRVPADENVRKLLPWHLAARMDPVPIDVALQVSSELVFPIGPRYGFLLGISNSQGLIYVFAAEDIDFYGSPLTRYYRNTDTRIYGGLSMIVP